MKEKLLNTNYREPIRLSGVRFKLHFRCKSQGKMQHMKGNATGEVNNCEGETTKEHLRRNIKTTNSKFEL